MRLTIKQADYLVTCAKGLAITGRSVRKNASEPWHYRLEGVLSLITQRDPDKYYMLQKSVEFMAGDESFYRIDNPDGKHKPSERRTYWVRKLINAAAANEVMTK